MSGELLQALLTLLSVQHLLFLLVGVALGLMIGILPGLGGTAMLALLLPFVFGKDPGPVLAMMVGLLAVNNTSDTFPAKSRRARAARSSGLPAGSDSARRSDS